MPDLPPSESVTVAPSPASCAALADSGIVDHAGRGTLGLVAHQRPQHAGRVGIAAGAGIVLGVGDDDRLASRPSTVPSQAARLRRANRSCRRNRPRGLRRFWRSCRPPRRHRPASCHRRTRSARSRRNRRPESPGAKDSVGTVSLCSAASFSIDAFGRLVVGALPADRDQERQLPERLCEALLRLQQQREMSARRRGRCRPCRHADRCDRRSARRHARTISGVTLACRSRLTTSGSSLPITLAHARQDFAFAVVEMLGDHRAVQVEIDGVERARRRDAVDQHLDDALIGVFGHMRRRRRRGEDGRDQFPAFGLRPPRQSRRGRH